MRRSGRGGESAPMDTLTTDAALEAAVDLARAAAIEESDEASVGDHLGMAMEDERLATHLFTCLSPAYRGWQWAVTIARAPQADPTVCDVVLLPGADAVVAPPWVPWSERVQPGDLGVGDVLPTSADDAHLTAGFTDADALEGVASPSPMSPGMWELGLGRVRVLSAWGRDEAADRWHEGDTGPGSPMAKHAALTCVSCGFLLTIGGPMGQAFGVCANRMAPADGRVVALDYGCGAHSEVVVEEVPAAAVSEGADADADADVDADMVVDAEAIAAEAASGEDLVAEDAVAEDVSSQDDGADDAATAEAGS